MTSATIEGRNPVTRRAAMATAMAAASPGAIAATWRASVGLSVRRRVAAGAGSVVRTVRGRPRATAIARRPEAGCPAPRRTART